MNDKTTRRTFFGGAAVLAAPLAATAAVANGDDTAARLAALEDANAIRALLQHYAQRVNSGEVAAPDASVRRLALDRDDAIDIVADSTATAQVTCTIETAKPIDGRETLVEMARLQGDGVIKRNERRVLTSRLVKRNGTWSIDLVELRS
jgi:lipoprotein-anchoring transpeptidase ErfK/SrfK